MPVALRINPNNILLWRDPQNAQLGVGAASLPLENLSHSEIRLIELLYRGVADEALEATAGAVGVTAPRNLIDRLGATFLTTERIEKPALGTEFLRTAFAEIIRASYLSGRDGIAVLESRAKQSVALDQLSKAGVLIALGLAASGVGRILTTDSGLVTEHEIGALGYAKAFEGRRRETALQEMILASGSSTKVQNLETLTPAKSRRALDVLVATHVLEPRRHSALRGKPHLSVVFGIETVWISPVVTSKPCLACIEHWRAESDSAWPAIASQLIGRSEQLEDSTSSMQAASAATGLILAQLDGRNVENLGAAYDIKTRNLTPWTWNQHPNCDC